MCTDVHAVWTAYLSPAKLRVLVYHIDDDAVRALTTYALLVIRVCACACVRACTAHAHACVPHVPAASTAGRKSPSAPTCTGTKKNSRLKNVAVLKKGTMARRSAVVPMCSTSAAAGSATTPKVAHMCTHTHARMHARMRTCARAHTEENHTHTHACGCARMRAHTRSHTHTPRVGALASWPGFSASTAPRLPNS